MLVRHDTLGITTQGEGGGKVMIIYQIIDEAQANAKARLLKVDDVMNAIKEAEDKLKELRIPKKYWIGCWVIVEPESVPVNYKFEAMDTYAVIVRKSSDWKLANVSRDKCKQEPWGRRMRAKLILSDVAHNHIPKEYAL